jgi:polyisoprenoid-binding protein YceI
MKNLFVLALLFASQLAIGQKYFSKTGKIFFKSDSNVEKIEAQNTSASTVIDVATGTMEWAVLIQGFKFEKALMQDHFNENYMESSKYPKAKFKGKIDNPGSINFAKDGVYTINVSGTLEMHGVTKPVTSQGTVTVKNGVITAKSKLSVLIADYNIEVPKLVADNVGKKVEIQIQADYQLMNAIP